MECFGGGDMDCVVGVGEVFILWNGEIEVVVSVLWDWLCVEVF